jgi:AraC-like DNA-binding protein
MKISPIEFKNSIKLSHAVNFLISGKSLEEICERLNFASPAFLRRLIKKRYNKTPKEIKKEKILL